MTGRESTAELVRAAIAEAVDAKLLEVVDLS